MRKIIFIVFCFILTLQSCVKEPIKIVPKNELEKFSKLELQSFDLDTLQHATIQGEKGTVIYYFRENLDIAKHEKVTLELKEIYEFEELLFNNINTITEKGELLESSGVLFLNFKSGKKDIELKADGFITIKTPEMMSEDDDIFSAKIDSLNQFKWTKEANRLLAVFTETRGRITVEHAIPLDSLDYYQKRHRMYQEKFYIEEKAKVKVRELFNAKLSWTNIDKLLKNVSRVSFEIKLEGNNVDNLTFYAVYEGFDSFYSQYSTSDKLFFDNIPYIQNATWIAVIGNDGDRIFANKVKINDINGSIFEMKLEEKNDEALLKMMRN